jgi:hypothetical protein
VRGVRENKMIHFESTKAWFKGLPPTGKLFVGAIAVAALATIIAAVVR